MADQTTTCGGAGCGHTPCRCDWNAALFPAAGEADEQREERRRREKYDREHGGPPPRCTHYNRHGVPMFIANRNICLHCGATVSEGEQCDPRAEIATLRSQIQAQGGCGWAFDFGMRLAVLEDLLRDADLNSEHGPLCALMLVHADAWECTCWKSKLKEVARG